MKNILKSIGWVILTFASQLIVQIVIGIAVAVTLTTEEPLYSQTIMGHTFLCSVIANLLLVLIAAIICKCKKLEIKKEWKFSKISAKAYILPCLIAFTYSLFFSLITYDPVSASQSVTYISTDFYGNFGIPMMILALLISAPVTEEIINRGVIMNTLKRSFSAKTSIIISAVIFGVMHIMAGGVVLAIGAAVIGVILAVIYEKTGSLRAAIASHIVANLPDFILYPRPEIPDMLRIPLAVAMLIASAVLMIVWLKSKKEQA